VVDETPIDAEGKPTEEPTVLEEAPVDDEDAEPGPVELPPDNEGEVERRKYYVDGGQVEIATHLVYELDADGRQLRVVKFTDYTAEKVRTLCTNAHDLRAQWADLEQRAQIIEALDERGISFDQLVDEAGQPDADPLDLLCHLAFNAPLRTRRERAQRLRSERKDFFEQYGPEARAVLDELLDKYTEHGATQFRLPDVLEVPPINRFGNVIEIAALFGGADKLRGAVDELQAALYTTS
jgi:type I restriction enzyme R subunit